MADDKLKNLLRQRDVINARIRQEQGRERASRRKADTRRKILAGAAVLDEAESREDFRIYLYKLLDRFLTRPADRALFGLPRSPSAADAPVEKQTVTE